MLLLAAFAAPAFACPTVATGTPAGLSFDTAQVAIARQGDRTTFSVSINPSGDAQQFALVLPVPEVLPEEAVRTLEGEIFARLDMYTAPLHVNDAGCGGGRGGGGGAPTEDSEGADMGDTGGGGKVDVEAEYLVGEYQVVILSAEQSGALGDWLDDNAYYLPEGADSLLQEYIDAGSYFLAAKVAEEAALANGEPLSPLQISYRSPNFAIPIRLATLNSPGEQDMVIYALTDIDEDDGGRVGISSYAEFEVKDKCAWGDSGEDFGEFYEDQFTSAWAEQDAAAWTVEFAGGSFYDCNPCSGVYLWEEDVNALGWAGDPWGTHLTRLHMRYTPEQAYQDLMLYGSGIYEQKTTSFADDEEYNYTCVTQFCDGSWTPGNEPPDDDGEAGELVIGDGLGGGCGCASRAPASATIAPLLVVAGLALGAGRRSRT
jgi:hypothetical protein